MGRLSGRASHQQHYFREPVRPALPAHSSAQRAPAIPPTHATGYKKERPICAYCPALKNAISENAHQRVRAWGMVWSPRRQPMDKENVNIKKSNPDVLRVANAQRHV
jgi:hypothetical protein